MAHQSEDISKLELIDNGVNSVGDIKKHFTKNSNVLVFSLPFMEHSNSDNVSRDIVRYLAENLQNFGENTLFCFLSSSQVTSEIYIQLHEKLAYQLSIAIKLFKQIIRDGYIPSNHANLLILSKYKSSLKHTKTRIAYTYCPVCDKTTKDYGGKKHLYHSYGTLMSDVWKDITYSPGTYPKDILERLTDLFGLDLYKKLIFFDFSRYQSKNIKSAIKDNQLSFILNNKATDNIINNSQLISGDCLEHLKNIPDSSVDFCFADPPYNLSKKYDTWNDNLETEEYFKWCNNWIDELMRVLKPGRYLALLNIPLLSIRYYSHLIKNNSFIDWIVWESLSMPVRMIMPSHYTILVFSKGSPIKPPGLFNNQLTDLELDSMVTTKENYCIRNNCINFRVKNNYVYKEPITNLWWDIHRIKHNTRRVDHPTQLPPKLMHRLITLFTDKNELVLDPFNGSGTTTLCAEQLNRKFLGIEKSIHYYELSLQRHNELRTGIDPFGKRDNSPKAKNSYVPRVKRQNYVISKKELQLEIKNISNKIGHIPSKEEVIKLGKYPIKYYEEYFLNWAEVCAAARTTGMQEVRIVKSDKNIDHQLKIF
jgi:site-specific DNA-methyltransferase (adenine-specific)